MLEPRLPFAPHAKAAVAVFGAAVAVGLAGCPKSGPAPARPMSWAPAWTSIVSAEDASVGGVAIAGDAVIATSGARVQRVDAGTVTWAVAVGDGAVLGAAAWSGETIAVAAAGHGPFAGLAQGLRGEPGAAIVGLEAKTGAVRWVRGIGSTEWVTVRSVAADGEGFVVAGAFAGTMRAGDRVVTSAGSSDGFWARIDGSGAVTALVRMGGTSADVIAGAIVLADGSIAIAGTFTGPAALLEVELPGLYNGPHADGFVARVTADGRLAWTRSWGGPVDDACAGLVATEAGVAVAGTVRGAVDVAGRRLAVRGGSDGLIAWFAGDGAVTNALLVGGDDLDAIVGVAGRGDRVIAIGWYAGAIDAPGGRLTAAGGDDPMLVAATPDGVSAIVPVEAPGAAAVYAIGADAGGWVFAAGAHEAARVGAQAFGPGSIVSALRW